jgi:hypothetical protein
MQRSGPWPRIASHDIAGYTRRSRTNFPDRCSSTSVHLELRIEIAYVFGFYVIENSRYAARGLCPREEVVISTAKERSSHQNRRTRALDVPCKAPLVPSVPVN